MGVTSAYYLIRGIYNFGIVIYSGEKHGFEYILAVGDINAFSPILLLAFKAYGVFIDLIDV